jgi:hypothetical protein
LNEAISRARSSTGNGKPRLTEDTNRLDENANRKMSPWKKLVWALGGKDAIEELQRSLAESMTQVTMMQAAAQMIVLQKIGRQRFDISKLSIFDY